MAICVSTTFSLTGAGYSQFANQADFATMPKQSIIIPSVSISGLRRKRSYFSAEAALQLFGQVNTFTFLISYKTHAVP